MPQSHIWSRRESVVPYGPDPGGRPTASNYPLGDSPLTLPPCRRLLSAPHVPSPMSPPRTPPALPRGNAPGIAVCARPMLEATEPVARHRHTRDVVSARPIAVAGETPVICSAGGTDPELLAMLRDGGLPVGIDLRDFRSE